MADRDVHRKACSLASYRHVPSANVAADQLQVVMLDATKKRCGFIDAAATHMGLDNVTAIWSRAEDAGNDPQLREASCVLPANPGFTRFRNWYSSGVSFHNNMTS